MKLTVREKAASQTGGMLDERVDRPRLIRLLKSKQDYDFDAEPIIRTLSRAAGWYRLMIDHRPKELTHGEIVRQAERTAAVIEALLERLEFMEPHLEASVDGIIFPGKHESVLSIRNRISPDLWTLRAGLRAAARQAGTQGGKRGRKVNQDQRHAFEDAVNAIREHSRPEMPISQARSLAREMLVACNVHIPEDQRELKRLASGKRRSRGGK